MTVNKRERSLERHARPNDARDTSVTGVCCRARGVERTVKHGHAPEPGSNAARRDATIRRVERNDEQDGRRTWVGRGLALWRADWDAAKGRCGLGEGG